VPVVVAQALGEAVAGEDLQVDGPGQNGVSSTRHARKLADLAAADAAFDFFALPGAQCDKELVEELAPMRLWTWAVLPVAAAIIRSVLFSLASAVVMAKAAAISVRFILNSP
jgi:hypothetical protein